MRTIKERFKHLTNDEFTANAKKRIAVIKRLIGKAEKQLQMIGTIKQPSSVRVYFLEKRILGYFSIIEKCEKDIIEFNK